MKTTNITTRSKSRFTLVLIAFFFVINVNAGEKPSSKTMMEESFESEMVVEAWMSDLSEWNLSAELFEADEEEEIGLEDWMLSAEDNYWNNGVDEEDEIEMEDWMLDLNQWK